MRIFVIACFTFCFWSAAGYVLPTVNLTSCLQNIATVTIINAEEGGLIYFRTDTAYNIIPSSRGTIVHDCPFKECNINWDEKFHVVVQRRVLYQTKYDVIIWFVCNTDFSAIQPVNINFDDIMDENLTKVEYTPEVAMAFYKYGVQLYSGNEVKLGEQIVMEIVVTNNDASYYDIRARSCYASGITLTEDFCAVDNDLFPEFNSSGLGLLVTTFDMFRPTFITGGPVDVVFTCILEVCLWNCEEIDCNSNMTVQSRKRRETTDNRGSSPSIVRGFTLKAVAEGEQIVTKKKPPDSNICAPLYAIVLTLSLFSVFVGVCIVAYFCNFNTYRQYQKEISETGGRSKLAITVSAAIGAISKQVEDAVKTSTGNQDVLVPKPNNDYLCKNGEFLKPSSYQSSYRRKSLTLNAP